MHTLTSVSADPTGVIFVVSEDGLHYLHGHCPPILSDEIAHAIKTWARIQQRIRLIRRELPSEIVIRVHAAVRVGVVIQGNGFGANLHVRNVTMPVAQQYVAC